MKRKLLTLSLAIFTALGSQAQVNISTGSPANNGATTQLRAPNGFADHTTLRAHMIIPAAEVNTLVNGDVVTSIGFTLQAGVAGNATGNIQFYLENTSDVTNLKSTTWATAIGTMTSVYNGAITLPVSTGNVNIDLPTNGAFTYTGGGIYVAYDYAATTFSTVPATYLCNNTIPGGLVMESTTTATPGATLTASSSFRPEIRFGLPNPNANDMTVNAVRPVFGHVNKAYQSSSDAFGYVTNTSNTTLTNVPVTLTVSGANTASIVETIPTIAPGAVETVTFSNIPTVNTGINTYIVSVPNDDVNTNNADTTTQDVSCSFMSIAPISPISSGLGYNTGTGILAIAVNVPAGAPAYIKASIPTISNDAASTGNLIKGVLVNTAGVIVDSTANYSITAGDLGQPVTLDFINGGVDYSGQTLYVGFRQNANANTGYFPMATSDQFSVFPGAYFTIPSGGGAQTPQTGFGAFLINAEVSFGDVTVTSNADANGNFCATAPVMLTASPAGLTSYDFVVGGSSVQNTASNTYMYSPTAASTYVVTGSLNGCTSATGSTTITPVTQYTSSFSDDFCTGSSYTFGTQTLTAGGTYNETYTSAGGCDSVVTLTLNEVVIDPSVTVTAAIATISANYSGAGITYQWIDCNNGNAPIPGATGVNFTPTATANGTIGSYAVIISEGGCTEQSACTTIDFTSVSEENGITLSVFPSPTSNVLNINTNLNDCLLYTSPSPRDRTRSRMPSSA